MTDTVQTYYRWDQELLERLEARVLEEERSGGDYWSGAQRFVLDWQQRPYDAMSSKQRNWMSDIVRKLRSPWE